MRFQNVAIILNYATPEGLSTEQATSAVQCFLQQQGSGCEPYPVGWLIGVPIEAEHSAPWVKQLEARHQQFDQEFQVENG